MPETNTEQKLTALALASIDETTRRIEAKTGGKIQCGIELEFVTNDPQYRKVDFEAFTKAANDAAEKAGLGKDTVTKYKNEGNAFIVINDAWIKNRDTAGRIYIPDLKLEDILDKEPKSYVNTPTRIQRREIVLNHLGVSPALATKRAQFIQEFTEKYAAEVYPGMEVSFSPKRYPDATEYQDPKIVAQHLKNLGKIPKDSNIDNFADLEKLGYHMVKSVPGNGAQRNYSIVDPKTGKSLVYDAKTDEGNDLSFQMMHGLISGISKSIFPFCSTHDSFLRHAKPESADPIEQAKSDAEARPGFAKYGEMKFEGCSVRSSPYNDANNQKIQAMKADRTAGYDEKRTDESYRIETRPSDHSGNWGLQVAAELAFMRNGIEENKGKTATQLEAELKSPAMKTPLAPSLDVAVKQFNANRDFYVNLMGRKLFDATLDFAVDKLSEKSINDTKSIEQSCGMLFSELLKNIVGKGSQENAIAPQTIANQQANKIRTLSTAAAGA